MAEVRLRAGESGEDIQAVGLEWIDRSRVRLTLAVDGETLAAEGVLEADGSGLLRIGARVVPFYAARSGDTVDLWLGGETYRIQLAPAEGDAPARPGALPVGGEITAPMPGMVLKVLVRAGDTVAAQAPLLVMESMKMQLTLTAPAAGRVEQVNCAPEQMVEMGAVLVRLTAAEGEN